MTALGPAEASPGELGVLLAESGIRRTLAEYCQACDDGRFADFAACFTPDGAMVVGDREVRGREALATWMAAAMPPDKRGRHLTGNTAVAVDGEQASAHSDFVFVAVTRDGPQLTVAGRYVDRLVRRDGRWLLARREIQLLPRPSR